jgi:hypothetical protein
MYEPDDIVRSVRRYLSLMLVGPPWTLRVERREVKDSERPVGVIEAGALTSPIRRVARFQGLSESILPITISLYPEIPATPTADSLREAAQEARKLQSLMSRWVTYGIPIYGHPFGQKRLMSGPFRFPLWDYEDVPLTGKDKAGPAEPHSVLWVSEASFSARGAFDTVAIQDPDDAARWSVIQNIQVSMENSGAGPNSGNPDEVGPITGLEGTFVGTGRV